MTMQNALHPDDERLAAYAGGDADALGDRELVQHLVTCDRCRPIVDELSLLRGALAALPDVVPSRPLRLIPPVPERAARGAGRLEWLRRLAAPAMAAGAGLVLIGAVGASGIAGQIGNLGMKAASQASNASDTAARPSAGTPAGSSVAAPGTETGGSAYGSRSTPPRTLDSGGSPSRAPASSQREVTFGPASSPSNEQPWLTLLIAGVALFATSAVLRFSIAPRAG
jgi:anti-sigma factor RsiW